MPDTEEATGGTAPTAPVQVITATRNLKSQPFNPGDDPIGTGKAWNDWLEEMKCEFRYFKITEPPRQERCTHHLWWEGNRWSGEKLTEPNGWR